MRTLPMTLLTASMALALAACGDRQDDAGISTTPATGAATVDGAVDHGVPVTAASMRASGSRRAGSCVRVSSSSHARSSPMVQSC